jgi:hypothetical protein
MPPLYSGDAMTSALAPANATGYRLSVGILTFGFLSHVAPPSPQLWAIEAHEGDGSNKRRSWAVWSRFGQKPKVFRYLGVWVLFLGRRRLIGFWRIIYSTAQR